MKNIYFTVGPSQAYPTIKKHIQSAVDAEVWSMSHRGSQFMEIYQNIDQKLKKLLNIPEDHSIFFLSSGTEGMERVIQNTVETNSFHIVTGTFGDRFYKTSIELGKNASEHIFDPNTGFSASEVSVPENAELIAFTHNDTSTGMQISMDEIYAVGTQNPDALIAIDTVSSMPAVKIDYSKVDAVFFSVQKGFGLPAGLGILILSPRAIEKSKVLSEKKLNIGSYHNFLQLKKYADKYQTPETPNVLGIYLFEKILGDLLEFGIDKIRTETQEKSDLMYQFFEQEEKYSPVVKDKNIRSDTTLVIDVEGGSFEIIKKLKAQAIIIGSGYGENKNKQIRVANFPAHSKEDINRLLSALKNV